MEVEKQNTHMKAEKKILIWRLRKKYSFQRVEEKNSSERAFFSLNSTIRNIVTSASSHCDIFDHLRFNRYLQFAWKLIDVCAKMGVHTHSKRNCLIILKIHAISLDLCITGNRSSLFPYNSSRVFIWCFLEGIARSHKFNMSNNTSVHSLKSVAKQLDYHFNRN